MSRRVAVLVGALVAVLAAAELVVLSGLLAAERRADRERYATAVSRQRRAAGRALLPAGPPASAPAPSWFCVRGVEPLVATIRAGLQKELVGEGRRLDVAALREVSDMTARAERYVELATAGPALPQRMGRERTMEPSVERSAGDPSASPEGPPQTTWKPLVPATVECRNGTGYASFRLDVPSPPVQPATAAPVGKAGQKKRKKAARGTRRGRP